jgi:hypothetical protein
MGPLIAGLPEHLGNLGARQVLSEDCRIRNGVRTRSLQIESLVS